VAYSGHFLQNGVFIFSYVLCDAIKYGCLNERGTGIGEIRNAYKSWNWRWRAERGKNMYGGSEECAQNMSDNFSYDCLEHSMRSYGMWTSNVKIKLMNSGTDIMDRIQLAHNMAKLPTLLKRFGSVRSENSYIYWVTMGTRHHLVPLLIRTEKLNNARTNSAEQRTLHSIMSVSECSLTTLWEQEFHSYSLGAVSHTGRRVNEPTSLK
jgi:hypothetical protein